MDVFIFKLKDNNNENVDLVKSYLASFKGPLKFKFDNEYIIEDKNLHKKNEGATLNWGELFFICNEYRQKNKINKNSFVIFLTKFYNQLSWFSAFDHSNNIFIETTHLEYYAKTAAYYPITYQITENIVSYLMKIDSYNIDWKIVHFRPIGCINDFCADKKELILKIQNANICTNCINILLKYKIDKNLIQQVLDIFESIRNDIIYKNRKVMLNEKIKKYPSYNVLINPSFQIKIKELNIEIKMYPALKILYLLFLKHEKSIGIKIKRKNTIILSDCKALLLDFYIKISPHKDIKELEITIDKLVHPNGEYFNQTRSKINNILLEILGEDKATDFLISGDKKNPYSVKMPKKNIHFKTK